MRTFSTSVMLFERDRQTPMLAEHRARLADAGVHYIASPVRGVSISHAMKPVIHTEDGEDHHADVVYPMLGETARSDLATLLGAKTHDCIKLEVDEFQCTSVPGLYAIGDVVKGLNQISVAAGQAAVAATRIHHRLPRRFC